MRSFDFWSSATIYEFEVCESASPIIGYTYILPKFDIAPFSASQQFHNWSIKLRIYDFWLRRF